MNNDIVIHDTGYGILPRSVMRNKDLSIEAKAIYAYFISFAGNTGKAFPSVGLIYNELNISKNRFYRHFNKLKELGYITVEQVKENGNQFSKNIYTIHQTPCLCFGETENRDTQNRDTQNEDTNNNSFNNNSFNNNSIYIRIVAHLNKKAGKSFNPKVKKTQGFINARLKEGFTEDDFIKVIDFKCEQWLGTKYEEYLRPETLFCTKFEGYLNAVPSKPVDEYAGFDLGKTY